MAITYQDLYNTVISSVSSICTNIANYSGVPNEFKSGYTSTVRTNHAYVTYTISNYISQFYQSTVESDFTSLLTTYGIDSLLNYTTTPRGLINFYNVLAIFCAARVNIAVSDLTSIKTVVYVRDDSYESANVTLPEGEIIYSDDMQIACNNIISIIGNNQKIHQIRYSLSLSHD